MADRPINRRSFFREGLRELLRPLARSVEPLAQMARQIGAMEEQGRPVAKRSVPLTWLRPPGSLPEQQFRDVCSRCGECVKVCPAQCIKIDPEGREGAGAPYIDPDNMSCVVCEGLLCMHHCPTAAIEAIPLAQINMGTAVWHEHLCARTAGKACTICVDRCPLGSAAIQVTNGAIDVVATGCIGCGVCQHECPTSPKSIVVVPRAALAV